MSDLGGYEPAGDSPAAPAGWYPVDGGQQRYWDGTQWTAHTAPLDRPSESPAPASAPGADPLAGTDPFSTNPFQPNPLSGGSTQGPTPYGAVPPGVTAITTDDRNMATVIHVLSLFSSFLGPLIIWLIKKDESAFIDHHGKEALNFQLTMAIAWICTFLAIIVVIGIFIAPILFIISLLFPILAAVGANNGQFYRYPLAIRFLR